jgi:hypothetical protein
MAVAAAAPRCSCRGAREKRASALTRHREWLSFVSGLQLQDGGDAADRSRCRDGGPDVTSHCASEPDADGNQVTRAATQPRGRRARLDDLEDAVQVQSVEAKSVSRNRLPIALVERMLKGEHPARIWREHRGLSLNALARVAGVAPGYLSAIENRKKPGSVAAYSALAKALGVTVDDLT